MKPTKTSSISHIWNIQITQIQSIKITHRKMSVSSLWNRCIAFSHPHLSAYALVLFQSFFASLLLFPFLLSTLLMLLCEDKPVSLFCSGGHLTGEKMLSLVHSPLTGWTTRSSEGGERWRGCKMEEAVARWMRHVSGCFHRALHPSFLFSSPPLVPFVLHSPTLAFSLASWGWASPSGISFSIPLFLSLPKPLKLFSLFCAVTWVSVLCFSACASPSFPF